MAHDHTIDLSKGTPSIDPTDHEDDAGMPEKSRLRRGLSKVTSEAGTTLQAFAEDELDRRRARYGHDIRAFSSTLRQVAPSRDRPSKTGLTQLPNRAADVLDALSDRVEHQSIRELGQAVVQTGRAHPALFLAGCIVGGLALGRILIASDRPSNAHRLKGVHPDTLNAHARGAITPHGATLHPHDKRAATSAQEPYSGGADANT